MKIFTSKFFSVLFSVFSNVFKSSLIILKNWLDKTKSNDVNAALIALSEEKFGNKAEKVAKTLKEMFIVQIIAFLKKKSRIKYKILILLWKTPKIVKNK